MLGGRSKHVEVLRAIVVPYSIDVMHSLSREQLTPHLALCYQYVLLIPSSISNDDLD
jgi:hypothetical protein